MCFYKFQILYKMKPSEKYWKKQDLPTKRDLLVKYYPNPEKKWSITKAMMEHIYNSETKKEETK